MGLAIISYLAVQSSSTLHLCLQPVRVDVCRSWSDGDLLKRYGLVDMNMGWITLGQLCGPLSLLENSVRVVLDSLLCRGIESTSFVMIWMLPGLDRNSWVLAGVAGGFSGKVDGFAGSLEGLAGVGDLVQNVV